ncbi:hypothetical protein BJ138DRAFT_1168488 [Hygrophoropsis aurantiaca]|uniref:Uncharacterized protein n=1 Tax=Hygrophoropsis aurantiaca TaxID=72124 RepID=A0ACB7ZR40_9AGAM|nr:hypothetical protein BJ138DRAFT_1168488 [Hygrophoropsis aurantiaca]
MLWSTEAPRALPPQNAPSDSLVAQLNNSFVQPYVGGAVDGFFEYLKANNKLFNSRPCYAKSCSIVQSSGTGKSRLLVELRHKGVIVIYMNLQPVGHFGVPGHDRVPATILTDLTQVEQATEHQYSARCCYFFAALFQTLQAIFELAPQGVDAKREYIRDWNDRMCTMDSETRATFFDTVQAQYDEIQIRMLLDASAVMVDAYRHMLPALRDISEQTKDEPQLVIAFDEAHPLRHWNRAHQYYLSHQLLRASVWVVFASTTSRVTDFSAPQAIHDSIRVAIAGKIIFPPYVQLGWDQHAAPLGAVAAKDASKAENIITFGRPLWLSVKRNPGGINAAILLAKQKLCNSSVFDTNNAEQALAALFQRFCLKACFGHAEAVQYVDAAVASHLCVCTSITEDRTWKYTSYPSEPFLSCVAAGLMHQSTRSLENTMRVLINKIDGGMLDIGKSGELASRLLWLLAKDVYVREVLYAHVIGLCTDDNNPDFIDCSGVPVIDFLEFVLGDPFTKELQKTGGREAFRGACINFSHWVVMKEFIAKKGRQGWSSNDWTLRHYVRSSAAQCCFLQPLVDKMIPILFNDDKAQDSDCVSQMFISDKAGKSKHNKDSLHDITRDDVSINCRNERPWIAILNDLGLEKPRCEVTFGVDKCLRIYISGTNSTSYKWMNRFPSILDTLRHLVVRQEEPINHDPVAERLQRQVQFGITSLDTHMRWESGKKLPHTADDDPSPKTESIAVSARNEETANKDLKGKKRELDGETSTTVKKSKVAK